MNDFESPSKIEVVRAAVERACKDVAERIAPLGFVRTKKTFWSRRRPLSVDFIHFHRFGSTYGVTPNFSVEFRVHFGIRVLNDPFPSAALNGPHSDEGRFWSHRYHLRFNAKSGSSYERCVDDLTRFIVEQGEPWFEQFLSVENLLSRPDSPLKHDEKQRLAESFEGDERSEYVANSLKILGIKRA